MDLLIAATAHAPDDRDRGSVSWLLARATRLRAHCRSLTSARPVAEDEQLGGGVRTVAAEPIGVFEGVAPGHDRAQPFGRASDTRGAGSLSGSAEQSAGSVAVAVRVEEHSTATEPPAGPAPRCR